MSNQRPPEPAAITIWRELDHYVEPVKCCHTCEFFDANGVCLQFGEAPPLDHVYASSRHCEDYEEEIPF